MKKQSIILVIFILTSFLSQAVYAQQEEHKEGQMPMPMVGLGKKVVVEVPTQPMFFYENSKKIALLQDFGFVAISFVKDKVSKKDRREYYKILRLVVSELNEPLLLENNLYVVRLTPGADEKKWNIFVAYMKRDKELDYVSRVFKNVSDNGVKTLLVPGGEIQVLFKEKVDIEKANQLSAKYPLVFGKIKDDGLTVIYRISDIGIDVIDLANKMFESDDYASVSPIFIEVKGEAITKKHSQMIERGMQQTAPEDVKEKARQKAEQKMQQQ